MRKTIVDTGFWFALYDKRDEHYSDAQNIYENVALRGDTLIIPFPTLYETLNTKFVSNKIWMANFQKIVNDPKVIKLYDEKYRNEAVNLTFKWSIYRSRHLSLTDNIIRLILDDKRNIIQSLATFNVKDFFDICTRQNIEILS